MKSALIIFVSLILIESFANAGQDKHCKCLTNDDCLVIKQGQAAPCQSTSRCTGVCTRKNTCHTPTSACMEIATPTVTVPHCLTARLACRATHAKSTIGAMV
uniref:Uncharacterized protein n=1 Tax=Ditylenchus dipsaci TaxID=166011 RepID=A0A915DRA3_9BILA